MAGNPNIQQGTLNRLRASVVVSGNTALNVTPSYLGENMITLAFDGAVTTTIPTATGVVQSGEPYQMVTVTMHLLKTQGLAAAYEAQRQSNSIIGNFVVTPDVSSGAGLGSYSILNGAIQNVHELSFNGRDAGYIVTLTGYLPLNNALW